MEKTNINPADITVLLADDNAEIILTMETILKFSGYKVTSATTVAGFKKLVKEKKADVILLDVNMDKENGYDICVELKAADATCHIPVILISGYENLQDQVINCGADDFLAKPFNLDDLLEKINHVLVNSKNNLSV